MMIRKKLLHPILFSSIILFSAVNIQVSAINIAETSKETRENTESEKLKEAKSYKSRSVMLSVPRRIPGALTGMKVLLSFRAGWRDHFAVGNTPARNLGLLYRDSSLVTQGSVVFG